MSRVVWFILGLPILVGCATMQGERALRQGRYEQAIVSFEGVVSRNPDRVDALVGLGVAHYKLGEYDVAADTLARAIALDPRNATARLYLGLSYFQKKEDGLAEEHWLALRDLKLHPRMEAHIERALTLMRTSPRLDDEMRRFIAASLDDEAEWAQDVQAARREAAPLGPGGPPSVIVVPARPVR